MAEPPALRVTFTLYVVSVTGTAVNTNECATLVGTGVVKDAFETNVKSDHSALPTGCTVTVQTMLTAVCSTGVVHINVDVRDGRGTIVYSRPDPLMAVAASVRFTAMVYVEYHAGMAVNTKDVATVVGGGVDKPIDVSSVKSDHSAFPAGCATMVHITFMVVWITGVVHESVEVDVGIGTMVYITSEPLIEAPPTASATATS